METYMYVNVGNTKYLCVGKTPENLQLENEEIATCKYKYLGSCM